MFCRAELDDRQGSRACGTEMKRSKSSGVAKAGGMAHLVVLTSMPPLRIASIKLSATVDGCSGFRNPTMALAAELADVASLNAACAATTPDGPEIVSRDPCL
jgi:hypothetical protein